MKSLFVALTVSIAFHLAPPPARAATYHVPDDFTKIQVAVDSVANGDIIVVRPGVYFENIDFHGKAVTLRSESGPHVTTIDGAGSGSVFLFRNGEGHESEVDGFSVINGSGTPYPTHAAGGAFFCQSSSPSITNNIITDNTAMFGSAVACVDGASPRIENNSIRENLGGTAGAVFGTGSSPVVRGNEISSNIGNGINLVSSDNCTISENDTSSNSMNGIFLHQVNGSTISGNTSCFNQACQGIFSYCCSGNTFSGNRCDGNCRQGIVLTYSCNNTLTDNTCCFNGDDGIPIWFFSHGNVVKNNTCNDNVMHGIHLNDSDDCVVHGNTFSGNMVGVCVRTSNNNGFTNNIIVSNSHGIHIADNSFGNLFHQNLFDNKEVNTLDECGNIWDSGYPRGGNYWSDYTGTDHFSGPDQNLPGPDGIGDTPYLVPAANARDLYPLMIPVGTDFVIDR